MKKHIHTCPICKKENIEADRNECPQCNSDLTCFKILDSLPDEIASENKIPDNLSEIPTKLDDLITEIRKIPKTPDKKKIYVLPFLSVCILLFLLLLVTIFLFAFYRISELETKINFIAEKASEEIRSRDAEIADIIEKHSTLDKNINIKILEQKLQFNKLLDQNKRNLIKQIKNLDKKNRKEYEKIQNAFNKSTGEMTEKQNDDIQRLVKNFEFSNKKIDQNASEIIVLLKKIEKNKISENYSLKLQIKNQEMQIVNLLIMMNKTLMQNFETNKKIIDEK